MIPRAFTTFRPLPAFRPTAWRGRAGLRKVIWGGVVLLLGVLALPEKAFGRSMASAAPGLLETGAPSFVVFGPEALGLSSAPKDLHLLPDGRVLVVSQKELAFGDGVRWETYRNRTDQNTIFGSVAVDRNGQLYTGTRNGLGRIDLAGGARWELTPVVPLPEHVAARDTTLVSVVTFADRWLWYGGYGAIVAWRPGETPHEVGNVGAVDRIFPLNGEIFVSEQSSGGLFRLLPDGGKEQVAGVDVLVSESVTAAIPFAPGELLVGTASAGLRIFDGRTFRPFGPPGLLNSGRRITDLCPTGENQYAASIDTVGIVFFDREGRTLQVLDRSLDHRLARVQGLRFAPHGVLWALLNDGVVRVEYPSPVSYYDPFIPSGLTYAQPLRHQGRLWMLADGRAMQGRYDAHGRLEGFDDETPPGRYLFTLMDVDGHLFASNDEGIFVRQGAGWKLVFPGIVNARFGVGRPAGGGIGYAARGEYGVIHPANGEYTVERIHTSELGDNYSAETDAAGAGWLELGVSRVGRIDFTAAGPRLTTFNRDQGLPEGWVEIYLLDDIARFHVGNMLYRFDARRSRFVEDRETLAHLPQLAIAGGRPVTDPAGRLWYTVRGATQVIDRSSSGGDRPVKMPSVGFAPTAYTVEDDGVVWMFEQRRLARVDLRIPQVPQKPVQALITSVEFPSSNRQVLSPGQQLAPLAYEDNSLVVRFAAAANPFTAPVNFEVLLEGAGTAWVSTGTVGSVAFNRLKEGDYVFRVRPVAAGAGPGVESRFAFSVRPPWYRTPLAWAIYAAAAAGLLGFVMWFSSYLQRRETERLERLVGERTRELHATNVQLGQQIAETTEKSTALAASEERYRTLNTQLEDRVRQRTAELSLSNTELQQRELLFRLIFEHAPVGISWKRADLGELYHINPAFRRTLDLPGGTLADHAQLATLVHPDDAAQHAEMNRRIAAGEADHYQLEERFVRPDGKLVWGILSVAVVRDEERRIIQEIGILKDITERKQSEDELAETHRQLVTASRQAGMAEVATGVLHNVGNVLNSVNVSATLVSEQVRTSKSAAVAKLAAMFVEHRADLVAFLTADPRGRLVPDYLQNLAAALAAERQAGLTELELLRKNVEHIKDIVAMQQSYAKTSGVFQTVAVADMVEDALRMGAGSRGRRDIEIVREDAARPVVVTDKHKIIQILVNLVRNAQYACEESGRPDKRIVVRTTSDAAGVKIAVSDNGVGIPAENLTRIFVHGFTTRASGHGFGLHSGALAARELGGSLRVESAGAGLGATFIIELPHKPAALAA